MKKLYQKSELSFALVWIGLYVVVMNIALQFCGGFDDLAGKTVPQVLVPVICICVLAVFLTVWIMRSGLSEKYGLCRFKGSWQQFLFFIPLIIMSCVNLKKRSGAERTCSSIPAYDGESGSGRLCGRSHLPGLSLPGYGKG